MSNFLALLPPHNSENVKSKIWIHFYFRVKNIILDVVYLLVYI